MAKAIEVLIPPEAKDDPIWRQRITDMVQRCGADTLAFQQEMLSRRIDYREHLARIPCPALVIVGDRDTITPIEHAVDLALRLPEGDIRVLGGVAHSPFYQCPDQVLKSCRDLLATSAPFTDPAAEAVALAIDSSTGSVVSFGAAKGAMFGQEQDILPFSLRRDSGPRTIKR